MTTEVKFGLVTAGGICLWVVLEHLLGFRSTHLHIGQYTGILSGIIPLVTIFYALKEKRDLQGGYLTLGQGLFTGLLLSMVTAICTTAFMWVYNQYINPGYQHAALEWEIGQRVRKGELDPVGAASARAEFKRLFSLPNQLLASLVLTVLSGLLITMVETLILRRSPARPAADAGTDPKINAR